MKKNNEGFSIVELVVVIALLSIFLGIFVSNIGVITGYTAKECYKKISSAITANKIETLGKATTTGDVYLEIYVDSTDKLLYARTVTKGNTANPEYKNVEKLAKKNNVKISYVVKPDPTSSVTNPVSEGHPLKICFNRATGAIESPANLSMIVVKAGTYTYKIDIVAATGKVKGK